MSRGALAVLLAGLLLVGGLVALGLSLLGQDDRPARVVAPPVGSLAPDARSADDYARAACTRLQLAVQGISAGSAADTVRAELAAARVLAAQALRIDGSYAGLSGGIAALDEAVRRDDPDDAATGVRVARQACDEVR